jgi:hypothetical protein
MTKPMLKLIQDAREAGLNVSEKENFVSVKRGSVIVIFWNDGTIHRGDVELALASKMTQKMARQALGLS